MSYITVHSKSEKNELYYESFGDGRPVVLVHSWPFDHRAWENQVRVLVEAGYRVITYDRRGFGKSFVPSSGYDFKTLAGDLHELITQLNLQDVALVGFSMGGGEVIEYINDYGCDNISKIALLGSIVPLIAQKEDNPNGAPQEAVNGILEALKLQRLTFLKAFVRMVYNDTDEKRTISDEKLQFDWNIACLGSPMATIDTAKTWAGADFRPVLSKVKVPALIVHGDADAVAPIKSAGDQAAAGIPNAEYHVIKGAPHGLIVTHKEEVNQLLLQFLNK